MRNAAVDGIHFSVRHTDQADSMVILMVLGVDMAGNKEVLALRAYAERFDFGKYLKYTFSYEYTESVTFTFHSS